MHSFAKDRDRKEVGAKALKLCLAWELQMTWGGQNTEAEAHEQLNYAFDHGINILDTAEGVITPLPLPMLDVLAFYKSSLMCSAMKHTLKQMEFKSLQDEVQSGQDP
jgi:hypothetical protein